MAAPEVERLVGVIRENAPTAEGWTAGFTAGRNWSESQPKMTSHTCAKCWRRVVENRVTSRAPSA
jgi:hypothetical protein